MKTISLPSQGRGKVCDCVHPTLPIPRMGKSAIAFIRKNHVKLTTYELTKLLYKQIKDLISTASICLVCLIN